MPSLSGVRRILREEGGAALLRVSTRWARNHLTPPALYDAYVRPRLPRRGTRFNGVAVRAYRIGDRWLPWHRVEQPEYETALVRELRARVTDGDRVVVIGGGWGVTSVVAATQGDAVTVRTFEGAREYADRVRETAACNGVADRIDVKHAVVGTPESVWGTREGARTVEPAALPACDLLVIDAEGAERTIVPEMDADPRAVLVETHGSLGSPTEEIRERLEDRGYRVIADAIAEEGPPEDVCRRKDIRVLVCVRD